MGKYSDNPIEEITGYLQHIESLLEDKPKQSDNSQSVTNDIQAKLNTISEDIKTIADSIDDEETRNEKIKGAVKDIIAGLKNDGVPLRPETQDALKDFFRSNLELDSHIKTLYQIADEIKAEKLVGLLEDASKEWIEKYKATIMKDVQDSFNEAEKKRKQLGKKHWFTDGEFWTFWFAMGIMFCFGFWGMIQVYDIDTVRFVMLFVFGAGIFIGGIKAWMKFKEWKDDRKYKLY